MIVRTAPSFNVEIHMAGSVDAASLVIQRHAAENGLCVTISPQSFIYTGGREEGFRVGFINYPRFPKPSGEIALQAHHLAKILREHLGHKSYSIVAPDETTWFSTSEDALLHKPEALAADVLQELADEAEKFVDRLTGEWNGDLGATAETKAAGVASHMINDFRGHIEAALVKLERRK